MEDDRCNKSIETRILKKMVALALILLTSSVDQSNASSKLVTLVLLIKELKDLWLKINKLLFAGPFLDYSFVIECVETRQLRHTLVFILLKKFFY